MAAKQTGKMEREGSAPSVGGKTHPAAAGAEAVPAAGGAGHTAAAAPAAGGTGHPDAAGAAAAPSAGGAGRPDEAGAAAAGEPSCSDAAPDADGSPCLGTASAKGAGARALAKAGACSCHHKETPRSAEFQADLQKRLNRAIGQLNGVKGMLEDNRYCGDVLVQLAAAESAIHNVSAMLLQNHLETCVVEQVQRGNTEVIDEVMQLIKRFSS